MFRHNKASYQSRYSIEKDIQNKIEPIEREIAQLKKRYEAILSDAQQTFEANEADYHDELKSINKAHTKEIRTHEKEASEALSADEKALTALKEKQSEELKTLKKDYEEKQGALETTIKEIEKDKAQTLKSIEQKHKKTTKAYQDKIDMYEQSLNDNRLVHTKQLNEAIKTLKNTYTEQSTQAKHFKDTITNEMETLKSSINHLNDTIKRDISQKHHDLDAHINAIRKSLNQNKKSLDKLFSQFLQTFNPMRARTNEALNTFSEHIKDHTTTLTNNITFDVKAELHRLEKKLNATDATTDKKTVRDIEEQIELNQIREKALNAHAQKIQETLLSAKETFQNINERVFDALKNSLQAHETLSNTLISQYKKKLDIHQNGSAKNKEQMTAFIDAFNAPEQFAHFQTFFEAAFNAIVEFEQTRISILNSTFETLKPYYEEMDEIRYFLDTKDARKEIAINNERIEIEQNDASIRKEMELTKRTHDKTINTIEYNHALAHKKALHTIGREKRTQTIADIKARNHANKERIEYDYEKRHLQCNFSLKEKHAHTDRTQVLRRLDVDKTIAEKNKQIKAFEALRHKELKLEEIDGTYTTNSQRLTLKINETSTQLDRLNQTIDQSEKRINTRFERQKEQLEHTYTAKMTEIDNAIKRQKSEHEDKKAFIKRAYERETNKANENIEATQQLKDKRLTPINDQIKSLRETLNPSLITSEDSTLKTVLTPLKSTMRNRFTTIVDTMESAAQEALETAIERRKETPEVTTKKKRLQQFQQKLDRLQSSESNTITTQFTAFKSTLQSTLNAPLKSVESKGYTSLKSLKMMVNTAINDALNVLDEASKYTTEKLDEWFDPINEADKELLEKAKHSFEQSIEAENTRFKQGLEPINKSKGDLQAQKNQELEALETKRKQTFNDELAQRYEQKRTLSETLTSLNEEKKTLEQWLKDSRQKAHQTYKDDLETLEKTQQSTLESIEARYTSQLNKIDERLEDARTLYNQSVQNAEAAIEMSENTLQDTLEANQEHFTYISETNQQRINDAEAHKNEAMRDAQQTLNADLERFEEQILNSKARLEDRIETVTRELDDQIRIKKERYTHLEKTISEYEYGVYDAFENAYNTMINAIQNAYDAIDVTTREGFDTIESLKKTHTSMVDEHIQSTIDDITSSTSND